MSNTQLGTRCWLENGLKMLNSKTSLRVSVLLQELLRRFRNQFVLQLMTAMSAVGY